MNELIARATYSTKKRPNYAYIGPILKQAKKVAWEYLKEYTKGLVDKVSESELYVRLKHNGAVITICGADNPDSFRGQYFDGVVLDEYADMHPGVWGSILVPALSDRQGWAVFIGTPKGKNHFFKIWDDAKTKQNWWRFILRASESGILSSVDLEIARGEMAEDEYAREYECDFNAAVPGTYYAQLINTLEKRGQIYTADAEYSEDSGIRVASDLGRSDSTALWFYQPRPDGIALIDYEESHGQDIDHYVDLLATKPYLYSHFYVPHDARAKTLATKKSAIEQFDEAFKTKLKRAVHPEAGRVVQIVPKLDLHDGIQAVRKTLPSCYFHPRTEKGVECLRAYRREWDEAAKVFIDSPVHDWASHGSDAFRYLSLMANPVKLPAPEEKPKIVLPSTPQVRLDDLWKERDRTLSLSRRRRW